MNKPTVKMDTRLIEAGFPCHQVGAETQRERGASSSLPPLYYLHIWWARRPLTPSRAAILASLLPADTDADWFLRQLGIERVEALLPRRDGTSEPWVINEESLFRRISTDAQGHECIEVDALVLRRVEAEERRRSGNRQLIQELTERDPQLERDPVLARWRSENNPIPLPEEGDRLAIQRVAADPAFAKERIEWEKARGIRSADDKYGYDRAYTKSTVASQATGLTVLDPTAGGGSIPFEALRLGHRVIANELNPVAAVILYATLDYPARFGLDLAEDISKWGKQIRDAMVEQIGDLFPASRLPDSEMAALKRHLRGYPDLVEQFANETLDGFLYCRQLTCPHCGGKSPLLNSCWLSKEGEQWGVAIVPDPKTKDVHFSIYRVKKDKGPNGEDPEFATVSDGVGMCIHCRQAIGEDEVKRQARGESNLGKWTDRLYCVVAVRHQPKLDREGKIQRYQSGERAGDIKTEKLTFFRPPNKDDLAALARAEQRLLAKWDEWDAAGLIPTEEIPPNSNYNRGHRMYGTMRWCDMFTPRQLIGHLTVVAELNRRKPRICSELGKERGRAVVTYLQFAIDKALDYNANQTMWHALRGVLAHVFTRHNFAIQWTFGEMAFAGITSGFAWALSQALDSYVSLAQLVKHRNQAIDVDKLCVTCGTAAHLTGIEDGSVDLVCMDPPYYDNVMYAELSDFFYVWMRRTLGDLYPGIFTRRLVNKLEEAVANPARDGSRRAAGEKYESLMREIFSECHRKVKDNGLLSLMFTHKSQDAWETLTRSLIESGWTISSAFPIESEGSYSTHVRDKAAAASSIFISCRKRSRGSLEPSMWTGFGGTGIQQRISDAVISALPEFERLNLNPVDEMVASYGRALRVLSENWPVLDGDEPVSPIRAMNEASRVVAERQVTRITSGRLKVDDLVPEATMALTLFGIYGFSELPYDDALNLSKSLNIALESRPGGYTVEGRIVGINQEAASQRRRTSREAESTGYHAPLIRKGSKLRLALPEERNARRLENPQTEWDVLQGLILAHRRGDIPVARAYLNEHADGRQRLILDLLHVWAEEMADETLRKEGQTMLFGLKRE